MYQVMGRGVRARSGVTKGDMSNGWHYQFGEGEGSHPLTSLVGQEFDALAVVGPCPVVPRHQLPAPIAVTAPIGMACR